MNFSSYIKTPQLLIGFTLISTALFTLLMLCWLLVYSQYGIELTDESFYFIWLSKPWLYSASATQFGFIYHPLYQLCQGNIILLRQVNILSIFILSWLLVLALFHTLNIHWRNRTFFLFSLIASSSCLIYFCPFGWLATPSYNGLIFQGLLVVSIGLFLADKYYSTVSIIGWLLIGLGGWLTFMAKPTSAAALALLVAICLPVLNKFNGRLLLLSIASAVLLLLASAYLMDGSISGFIQRLKMGVEMLSVLGAKNSPSDIFRFDALQLKPEDKIKLVLSSLFILAYQYGGRALRDYHAKRDLPILIITGLLAIVGLTQIGQYFLPEPKISYSIISVFLLLAVPLSAYLLPIIFKITLTKQQWTLALYFLLLPTVFAFGSGNNIWQQGSLASFFWFLSGLTLFLVIQRHSALLLLPILLFAQFITLFALQAAIEHPYRQAVALYKQDSDLFLTSRTPVKVTKVFSDYVADLRAKAALPANTPMIDLTGSGSGLSYLLNANTLAYPWLIASPAFSGSKNMAVLLLKRLSCTELAAAWVLLAPNDLKEYTLPTDTLNEAGLNFPNEYGLAVDLATPDELKIYFGIPKQRLQLWKPIKPIQDIIKSCEHNRLEQQP